MSIPQIAVWGASNVGKTTYLAGAMLALPQFYPKWHWIMGGEGEEMQHTHEFITSEMGKLEGGKIAGSTTAKEPERYLFRLEQRGDLLGRTGRYHEIALIDVAGRLTEDTTDTYSYFETLRNSQGILMLIDPMQKGLYEAPSPERSSPGVTYLSLFNLLIRHLQATHAKGARLEMPIAICLTKMDQDENWPYRDKPQQYLEETLGKASYGLITKTFSRKKLFVISTVGRYRDPRTGQEISNLDSKLNQLLNFKLWQPYHNLDPIFWLLDHLERVRDQRLPLWRRLLRRAVREPNYKK